MSLSPTWGNELVSFHRSGNKMEPFTCWEHTISKISLNSWVPFAYPDILVCGMLSESYIKISAGIYVYAYNIFRVSFLKSKKRNPSPSPSSLWLVFLLRRFFFGNLICNNRNMFYYSFLVWMRRHLAVYWTDLTGNSPISISLTTGFILRFETFST